MKIQTSRVLNPFCSSVARYDLLWYKLHLVFLLILASSRLWVEAPIILKCFNFSASFFKSVIERWIFLQSSSIATSVKWCRINVFLHIFIAFLQEKKNILVVSNPFPLIWHNQNLNGLVFLVVLKGCYIIYD